MESKTAAKEKEILRFWQEQHIFEKTLQKDSPNGDYIFYDGPPFATGTPHYGHLVASIMKDVVPRYWTMRGYHVDRVWGWDCHGLPIENLVEKELGFKSKKDILAFGIAKFNEACRARVLEFAAEWQKTIPRLGRWVDMEHAYKTMDLSYMESVWWVFKELWDKGLIYEGSRIMQICPRCETTLSQQEVSEGYKMVKDISVIAKFEISDQKFLENYCGGQPASFLAWTTTPWSLPTTMALAIDAEADYVLASIGGERLIFTKARLEYVKSFKPQSKVEIIREIKGQDLAGVSYRHPFIEFYQNHPLIKNNQAVFKTYPTEYVSSEEGTGIVTINGAYGEIDMESAKKFNLPIIVNVKVDGTFDSEMGPLAGHNVKPIDDIQKTDREIVQYLVNNNTLFAEELYEHSYPHCWRCDTPLINYSTTSWFVNVTKVKPKALQLARKINWSPEHIKAGRFGKWLEGARDWSISRQRFWASVMPIWECECGQREVFGSVSELEKVSGKKITDLHKHFVDEITFICKKCGKTMKRIPDVLDTWFDSGSMPYAQLHYPFENKDKLEENFPAEFIAEGADQTRAWFYYLHVIATAIKHKPAYKNVIVNGIVLAEDGKKMSKKLSNYPDPNVMMDTYGADALRYYLLTSPVMEAETLNFSESGVKEALQKNVMLISNVLSFYLMYKKAGAVVVPKPAHVLDKWILAKLQLLNSETSGQMDKYNLVKATRPIAGFINELSTWYLRRSRERFKVASAGSGQANDEVGIATLGYAIQEFSKLAAPFMPFIAEELYRSTGGRLESVHLEQWPKMQKKFVDEKLISEMETVLTIVEKGLAARAAAGIKVRQPLARFTTKSAMKLSTELIALVCDELNIKALAFGKEDELDTAISDQLRLEGAARELIRQVNQLRKAAGLTIKDFVILYQNGLDDIFTQYGGEIKKATLASEVRSEKIDGMVAVGQGSVGIKK